MSSEIAIRARDISKHYVIFARPEDRLKQMIVPRLQRALGRPPTRYYRDFAALNGVSFDIRRGETIGIIGRNGSGKSTLLQIVCGTLQPTSGNIEVNGRIAALLELGAGFNPEFTGRENVYLNAAILGLSRTEIDARFDEIARFADIGDFIEQPVKTYSSGMYVRLAFATAINVDPDILVVDEALAVGDEAFQRKCFARIEQIKERGGTILFVSHSAQTIVQLCDRAMLIDAGEKILEGAPKAVVNQYHRIMSMDQEQALRFRQELRELSIIEASPAELSAANIPETHQQMDSTHQKTDAIHNKPDEFFNPEMPIPTATYYQNRGARLKNLRIETSEKRPVNTISMRRRYHITYEVDFDVDAENVAFGFTITTQTGLVVAGVGTSKSQQHCVDLIPAGTRFNAMFDFECRLTPGTYFVTAGVSANIDNGREFLDRVLDGLMFKVNVDENNMLTGYCDLDVHPTFLPSARK